MGADGAHRARLLGQLPGARRRRAAATCVRDGAPTWLVDRGPGTPRQPPAARRARRPRRRGAQPRPPRPLGRPLRAARRPEVRASGASGLPVYGTAENRAIGAARARRRSSPPSTGHVIGDGDRVDGRRARASLLAHRPLRRDPTPCGSTPPTARSLVYTADTGPGWSLAALGDGRRPRLCRGDLPAPTPRPRASCTSPPARPGAWPARPAPSAWCSPTSGPASDPAVHAPRRRRGRLRCARSRRHPHSTSNV